MIRAGLGYLATADAAQLPAAVQAEALRELEQTDAIATAARAGFLAAFTAGAGPAGDGDYSAVSWLIHRTGITRRGAARGPDRRVRRRGGRGAGRAGRPGREGGRPDQGPAVPRRAGRGDAPANRQRHAPRAGRAAG